MTQRTFVGHVQNHVVDDAYELFDIMPERRFTMNVFRFFVLIIMVMRVLSNWLCARRRFFFPSFIKLYILMFASINVDMHLYLYFSDTVIFTWYMKFKKFICFGMPPAPSRTHWGVVTWQYWIFSSSRCHSSSKYGLW